MLAKERSLGFETLESRRCLAVSAELAGGNLLIGGVADGDVAITATDVGTFQVTDNGVDVGTISGVTKDIRINIDAAGDATDDNFTVDLAGQTVKRVTANLGDGDNSLTIFGGTLSGGLKYQGGDGDDRVEISDDAEVQGDVRVRLGDGDNSLTIAGQVGRGVTMVAGGGDDQLSIMAGAIVNRGVLARLGDGDNEVWVEGEIGRDLSVTTGDGNDTVDMLAESLVNRSARISLGSGDNSLLGAGVVRGNLVFCGGEGNDMVEIPADGSVGRKVDIRLGEGENSLLVDGTVEGDLNVTSGNAGDMFVVDEEASIGGTTNLTPGEESVPGGVACQQRGSDPTAGNGGISGNGIGRLVDGSGAASGAKDASGIQAESDALRLFALQQLMSMLFWSHPRWG